MIEKLNTILLILCRSISTRKLYFPSHPKVMEFSREFMTSLEDFCRESESKRLFVGVVKGELVYEGKILVGPSIIGRQLIDFADRLHCGGFSFSRQVTEREFGELLNLTSELTQPVAGLGEARELLRSRGITNIEIAGYYIGSSDPEDEQEAWRGQDTGEVLQSPTLVYQALFDAVSRAHTSVASGDDIDVDRARSVSEYLLHFTKTRFSDVMQYVHYPDYDSYTVGHSVRVATLAVFVAWAFGWNRDLLLALGTAGLLHDVGKGMMPQEILFKKGRLTDEEMGVIKSHPRLGAEILLAQKHTTPLDIAAAWGHHIRHDGGGYPPQAPWMVRHPIIALLQICDVFEALTAARPYKVQLTPSDAFGIMMADLSAFQPSLLASFIHVIGIYPPGNTVVLSDGSRGNVAWVGAQIDRPTVEITHDPSGRELLSNEPLQVDLSSERYRHLSVVELLV
ncbi:MAG: HD domain-containing protein [Desulfocapsaceae bacterium]|nr:HD domain-containing protein [Desulfocapsaceae bacterium]